MLVNCRQGNRLYQALALRCVIYWLFWWLTNKLKSLDAVVS